MSDTVLALIASVKRDNPSSQIVKGLSEFRSTVNPQCFKSGAPDANVGHFADILGILVQCCENDSLSVRMEVYTTAYAFLSKVARFYSEEMQDALIKAVNKYTTGAMGSVIFVAVFAFLTNLIADRHIDGFVTRVTIFHHFTHADPEHLPNIIGNLGKIGDFWYTSLLNAMVVQCLKSENKSLHVLVTIRKIIEKKPDVYFLEILTLTDDVTIIAFLLSSLDLKFGECDLAGVAKQAMINLRENGQSGSDDCLRIIATKSKSFSLKLRMEGEHVELEVAGEKVSLVLSEYCERNCFYLLPLPMCMLVPKDEDTVAVVQAKFKTISRMYESANDIVDVKDVITLIDEFSDHPYDEKVSCCLKCLSKSMDCLIANANSLRLVRIVRRLLHTKCISWIHANDVLDLILAIQDKMVEFIPFTERIEVLIEFVGNPNEGLAKKASKAIARVTTPSHVGEVTRCIAKKIDLFEDGSLRKNLGCLKYVMDNYSATCRDHLLYLVNTFDEFELDGNLFDLSAMCGFLQFFSVDARYVAAAKAVIYGAITNLTGVNMMDKVDSGYTSYAHAAIDYIRVRSVEIISEQAHDFGYHMPVIYNAYCFLMSQNVEWRSISFIVNAMFEYFPVESARRMSDVTDLGFAARILPRLKAINNTTAFALLVKLSSRQKKEDRSEMVGMIKYYLVGDDQNMSAFDFFWFCWYMSTFDSVYENLVRHMICEVADEQVSEFLGLALSDDKFASLYSSELSTLSNRLPFSLAQSVRRFDQCHEDKKMLLLHRVIASNSVIDIPVSMVDFGVKHLTGWNLEKFKCMCKLQNIYETKPFVAHRGRQEIENMIVVCLETDETTRLPFLLNMATVKGFRPDFTTLDVSDASLPLVAGFLRRTKQPMLQIEYRSIEARKFLVADDPAAFIDSLLILETFRKKDIITMCKSFTIFQDVPDTMFSLLTRLFVEAKPHRLPLVVKLAALTVNSVKNVPESFAQFLLEWLPQNADILASREANILIWCIAKKLTFTRSQEPFLRMIGSSNITDMSFVHASIISSYGDRCHSIIPGFEQMLIQLIDSEICSQFLGCIRILTQCVQSIPDLVGPNLSKVITIALNHKLNYSVGSSIASYLKEILKRDMPTCHKEIAGRFSVVLSHPERIPFVAYRGLLAHLIIATGANSYTVVCDKLLQNPANMKIFTTWASAIDASLSKIADEQERKTQFLGLVRQFDRFVTTYDCYNIARYVMMFVILMKKILGGPKALEIVTVNILVRSKRFFPAFYVFIRLLRSVKGGKRQGWKEEIASAVRHQSSATHICALDMLASGEQMREVLDIASQEAE